MELVRRLCRYNAWANKRVFDVCLSVDPQLIEQQAPGTFGTVVDTVKHFTGVEDAYLAMLSGQDLTLSIPSREEYLQRDFAWFVSRSPQIGAAYLELLDSDGTNVLARSVPLLRLSMTMPAYDAFAHVLTHSAHHRAQVMSALGAQGIAVGDLDYLFMFAEKHQ